MSLSNPLLNDKIATVFEQMLILNVKLLLDTEGEVAIMILPVHAWVCVCL